jgi:malate dehydrogenase (oxaloacetate-decarboxylating)(NADP+)
VALCSHSNFGSSLAPSAQKMRDLLEILRVRAPELQVDGEMHGDLALDPEQRKLLLPDSALAGEANLLVMPNLDAASISYSLLKAAAGGNVGIGPMLLGAAKPVHVVSENATVRRIVNLTAVLVAGVERSS